jgi:hypothetical protein
MFGSIRLFFKDFFKSLYSWIGVIVTLYFYADYTILKFEWEFKKMPLWIFPIIGIIFIMIGSIETYHKLRKARLEELYRFLPEANRDRVFRIFFNLYKEGMGLKDIGPSGVERKQDWDREVLLLMKEYLEDYSRNNYLIATKRRYGESLPLPLKEENCNDAVSEIYDIVFAYDFNRRVKQ